MGCEQNDNRSQSLPHNRCLVAAICGLLLLAVALVFGQTVRHGFINLDDGQYVLENRHVTRGMCAEEMVWALYA